MRWLLILCLAAFSSCRKEQTVVDVIEKPLRHSMIPAARIDTALTLLAMAYELNDGGKCFGIAPAGILGTIALIYAGTEEDQQKQLADAFSLRETPEELASRFEELERDLSLQGSGGYSSEYIHDGKRLENVSKFEGARENDFNSFIESAFYSSPHEKPMMISTAQGEAQAVAYSNDAWKYLELKLAGSPFTLALVMPKDRILPVSELVKALNGGEFTQLGMAASTRTVSTIIPQLNCESALDIRNMLERLGVSGSGYYTIDRDGEKPLEISGIIQTSSFAIKRKVHSPSPSASRAASARQMAFHADRPFLWFLIDKEPRVIIFAGWYGGE